MEILPGFGPAANAFGGSGFNRRIDVTPLHLSDVRNPGERLRLGRGRIHPPVEPGTGDARGLIHGRGWAPLKRGGEW